jgi:hypothetical protein
MTQTQHPGTQQEPLRKGRSEIRIDAAELRRLADWLK